MGLGAHGGGLATARFCHAHGARVTVTDLRSERDLGGSVDALPAAVDVILGKHRAEDFKRADIVFKNPAVPRTSSYLRHARRVETDISWFLASHPGRVHAVTGTKGKSTTASALHHLLSAEDGRARLGGNITVSPLSFLDDLLGDEPVVLELSSFQLGDLLLTQRASDPDFPAFATSIVTNILPDHQDYYDSMEAYEADKTVIFRAQHGESWVVLCADDPRSARLIPPHRNHVVRATAQMMAGLVPASVRVVGEHQRMNLLLAAIAAQCAGMKADTIRRLLAGFKGVPHRLEYVRGCGGVEFFNDSAATIAEAALLAVRSFDRPVHLIAGGSDKGLPMDDLIRAASEAASLHLLSGTGTQRILSAPHADGLAFTGPHDSLEAAVKAAQAAAAPGGVILLSPGCASFGMFRNEFDRGDQFRNLVQSLECPGPESLP